jgi:ferric-dicitrate binding protein FerR (iron transport regulator)
MDSDRLDALFERFLDDALSADEQAELEALLAAPEAQRRWRELASLEGKLLEELGQPRERARKPARRVFLRRLRPGQTPATLAWAAAALLALAGIVLAVLAGRNGRPGDPVKTPVVHRAPEPEPEPEPVSEPTRPKPPAPAVEEPAPAKKPDPSPPERTPPAPKPVEPAPPRPEPAPPRPEPPRETVAVLARLEQAKGNVFLKSASGRVPAKGGQDLLSGHGLATQGRGSLAVIAFGDGTRVEVGSDTDLATLSEGAAEGKRIVLERGFVEASVTRQPAGRPLVLATPNAEARVLGTTLRLLAERDQTRLEVEKGHVRLQRLSDLKAVDVLTGHFAVAAVSVELASRPLPARPVVVSFTLINADTEQPIAEFDPLRDGAVLNLSRLPTRNLNLRANVSPRKVGCVRFSLDGTENYRVELGTTSPVYSLAGDMNGKYNAWTPAPGDHAVTATPYADPDVKGPPGSPLTVRFRVVAR